MRPMPELDVVKVPTSELVEYANNAKLHPHEQVDQIAASIEEFGFNSPILAWHNDEGDPEIVAGHGRLMAARRLGLKELPVVFLDHMSDEQRRAYILVDNQLTLNSDFDMEALAEELDAITTIDMSEYGLDDLGDMEFMDFDGDGDGGGSRMQEGSHVRIVLGPFICEMKDVGHKYYEKCKELEEERVTEAIRRLFDDGILP